jgi:hypothetical protein
MSIGAIASGIWHSVSSALASPRPQTAGFPPDKPARSATPPAEAGTADPARQKTLADLQTWIAAQQQGGAPAANPARVRNAYAATSALGAAG